MRLVYSFFMYLLTPYILLRLWWKSRRLPAYRKRIPERFCLGKRPSMQVDVWMHAVSLGEVIAAIPLIDTMLDKGWSVLVTTMTPTGSERVKARFGDKVAHQYVPYDLPDVLRRFFKQVKPRVGVIMETELWPNLIYHAHAAKIPLFLANARLSERSFQGYVRFRFLFKPILQLFSGILVQTEEDGQRFIALGAKKENVIVLGNVKFDLQTDTIDTTKFIHLKQCWGEDRIAVIAASTHEDEEWQILSQLKRLQAQIPRVVLLIAPRHPERFQKVYQLCQQAGFNTGLRSLTASLNPENDVVVLDSLGELLGMYMISDYAFVGGSFVPVGGHNVLEPIAMHVPVLSGPQVHNFKAICSDLDKAQAIQLVNNADELVDAIIQLYQRPELRKQMIERANGVLKRNKGAVMRHMERIEKGLVR